jgi:dolichyl-phosphate-mannose--protein O-mannosyl transferase
MFALTIYLPLAIAALFAAGLIWDWRHTDGFRRYHTTWLVLWRVQAVIAIAVMLAIAAGGYWFTGALPR